MRKIVKMDILTNIKKNSSKFKCNLLDPDPANQINADPFGSGSGSRKTCGE